MKGELVTYPINEKILLKFRPPDLWEFELKQKLIRIPLSACNHFVDQS